MAQQIRVDDRVLALVGAVCGVVEQVEDAFADQHVLPQRDGPVLVDDDRRVAAHGLDPAAELLGVAHRRRQADQSDVVGQMQDDFLPHRTAHPVGEEMHLVHHYIRKSLQRRRIRIQHVAQHFGGHHHDGRVRVDRLVAGQQPDLVFAVARDEIVVLLVAQRLDRRGVEALGAGCQRQVHGEFADNGLARPGRRAHQDTVAALQRRTATPLEAVEFEGQVRGEPGQLGPDGLIR